MSLNPKQAAFVREYLVDLNATQAAIRAGYSAKTASAIGPKTLSLPNVAAAVQETMNKRAKKVGLTAADVLRDIELVKADAMQLVFDREGKLLESWGSDFARKIGYTPEQLVDSGSLRFELGFDGHIPSFGCAFFENIEHLPFTSIHFCISSGVIADLTGVSKFTRSLSTTSGRRNTCV